MTTYPTTDPDKFILIGTTGPTMTRPVETLTDAAMRELRAGIAEWTRRALTAEAQVLADTAERNKLRHLLRDVWDATVLTGGLSGEIKSRIAHELNKE